MIDILHSKSHVMAKDMTQGCQILPDQINKSVRRKVSFHIKNGHFM